MVQQDYSEKISHLFTLFKTKQEKQMEVIKEELGSVIDEYLFDKGYAYATAEKFGSLTIGFNPKTPCRHLERTEMKPLCLMS